MSDLRIVILSRSARAVDTPAWGLGVDSKLIEQVLREIHASGKLRIGSVDHIDPISFYGGPRKPRPVDIQLHLEVPCRAAWSWAKINIVVINPEWWPKTAWNWVLDPKEKGGADILIFKSTYARTLFPEVDNKRVRIVSWRADPAIELHKIGSVRQRSFLYLIGASTNKLAAAKVLLPMWKASWPNVTVVGTSKVISILKEILGKTDNIELRESFTTDAERIQAQQLHEFHIVASAAEGFGYTLAEAATISALPLWTNIPIYNELYGNMLGNIGRIECTINQESSMRDFTYSIIASDVERAVESLLNLSIDDKKIIQKKLLTLATERIKEFRNSWRMILGPKLVSSEPLTIPPKPLPISELPEIAIVTLTHNRPRWFANMARNILGADYPKNKLTWIVVDDSEGIGRIDADIIKFQSKYTEISVKYISLAKPMALGDKRNKACAASSAPIILMMDDDDHYPPGSIHARVAWLKATGADCIYCSTLPMYDCGRYISAMNVPPLDLAAEERVSEATLCFKRSFWETRGFPDGVSIAEGEGFLSGRIEHTAEIPPEGIIVSFLHGANATSRRVPESSEPNGCHYGFDDEFFLYLSDLATNQSKPQT